MSLNTSEKVDGQRAMQRVVDAAVEYGDAVENHYLEIKSDVDPASKEGAAKIAKFLLGAANRLPANAAEHFGGYAYMLVGVAKGSAVGVEPVDVKTIEDRVRKFLNPDHPPRWDVQFMPVLNSKVVLFISVSPPADGDPVHICHAEYQGSDSKHALEDGRIYYRERGSTRAARSGEVKALIRRARQDQPKVDIDVLTPDCAARFYAQEDTELMLKKLIAFRSEEITKTWHGDSAALDRKLAKLSSSVNDEWHEYTLAAAAWPGMQFTVVNNGTTDLKNVQVRIQFPKGFIGIEKTDADKLKWKTLAPSLFPKRKPQSWPGPLTPFMELGRIRPLGYPVSWVNIDNICLSVTIDGFHLRPHGSWTSQNDDLVVYSIDPMATEVDAEWVLTAEGIHQSFTGTVCLPVKTASVHDDLTATVFANEG